MRSFSSSVAPLALLTATTFAAVTTEVLPVGLLPQLAASFGVSPARIGWWVTAYAVVVAVGAIPVTVYLTRLQRRSALVGLLIVYAVSNVVVIVAPDYWWAVSARVLGGVAHAGIFTVVVALATELAAPGRGGRAVAAVNSGVTLALTVGVPLGTAIGTVARWQWAFAGMAALFVILAASSLLLVPVARGRGLLTDGSSDLSIEGERPPPVLAALRSRGLLTLAGGTTIVALGHYTAYTYITPVLISAGVPAGRVSLVLFGYGAASLGGVVVAGLLADRGHRSALPLAVLALVASLLALAVSTTSAAASSAVVIAWGAVFGTLPTLLQTAALRASRGSDTAPAVVNATFNVGIAAGAALGGLLLSDVPAMLVVAASIAALGAPFLTGPGHARGRREPAGRVADHSLTRG